MLKAFGFNKNSELHDQIILPVTVSLLQTAVGLLFGKITAVAAY